jgi:hypothetical protein
MERMVGIMKNFVVIYHAPMSVMEQMAAVG